MEIKASSSVDDVSPSPEVLGILAHHFADKRNQGIMKSGDHCHACDDTFTLVVATLTGKRITFNNLTASLTIGDVMDMIHKREKIPTDQQRLIFMGRRIDDDDPTTLVSTMMGHNSLIHLVLRLRGGAATKQRPRRAARLSGAMTATTATKVNRPIKSKLHTPKQMTQGVPPVSAVATVPKFEFFTEMEQSKLWPKCTCNLLRVVAVEYVKRHMKPPSEN